MQTISRNIIIIEKHFRLFFKNSLQQYELNSTEGMVLLLLYEKETMPDGNTIDKIHHRFWGKTQDEMIDEIHYDKSVMTRTMQTLESKGYVKRNPNPDDNRSYIFTLTKKAADFQQTLFDILRLWQENSLKGIPPEEAAITEKTLSQMSSNILELMAIGDAL